MHMRKAVYFRLKPGMGEEYKRRHGNIPDEMRRLLSEAGLRNYSIWNWEDMLFAYYEVEDETRMERILQGSSIYHQWRKLMEDVILVDQDGQKEWMMKLMFLHEGDETDHKELLKSKQSEGER